MWAGGKLLLHDEKHMVCAFVWYGVMVWYEIGF